MTAGDLNDMQRYLIEEDAEKWQQGRITRRELLRRVTLMVGGAAAANSVLLSLGCGPAGQEASPSTPSTAASVPGQTAAATAGTSGTANPTATQASGQQDTTSPDHVAENDPAVRAQMVEIPSSDSGVKLQGYLAAPSAPSMGMARPAGVLVIHENRGLTDYIKDVVRRLAKANFTALCVDLVSRKGGSAAHADEAERTAILGKMAPEQIISDLSAGLEYLKGPAEASPERLGAIGFCFGGGYTWRLATKRQDLKAGVAFYGPNPPLEDVPNIKAAMLGIYGESDTRITSKVPELEQALQSAKVTSSMHVYGGANHAFHNDTGANYEPTAAQQAWAEALDWLRSHL
ncbi:MAG TPA: dienelactone hydrolase family protein [Chloroflexia bacterium]|nr:dienelactone hydrolase family protein [Chloroflexia bacterium]